VSARFQFDRQTPVTIATLVAYVGLAVATGSGGAMSPSWESLDRFGGAIGTRIAQGEVWRLLSYAYLHGGVIHLACNALALWSLGPQLERLLGSAKFLLLYAIAGICGGLAGILWHEPLTPLVGGSGSLFGLMGAAVAMNVRHGKSPLDFLDYEGPRQLIGLIFTNFVLGMLIPMVSNAGHLGGLIGGFVLVHQFYGRTGRHAPDRLGRVLQAAWIALAASVILWAVRPVTRWDWLGMRLLRARDAAEAEPYGDGLRALGESPELLLDAPDHEEVRDILVPKRRR
jgi:membrane associated rhomboid family serine protease